MRSSSIVKRFSNWEAWKWGCSARESIVHVSSWHFRQDRLQGWQDRGTYLCMLEEWQCTVAQEAEIMIVAEGYPIKDTGQDGWQETLPQKHRRDQVLPHCRKLGSIDLKVNENWECGTSLTPSARRRKTYHTRARKGGSKNCSAHQMHTSCSREHLETVIVHRPWSAR